MDSARMGVIRRMNMMHFMVVEMREAVDTGPDTSTQGARVRRCLSAAVGFHGKPQKIAFHLGIGPAYIFDMPAT